MVGSSRLRAWSCCLKACDKVERKVAANFLSSDLFMALMIITDVEALRGWGFCGKIWVRTGSSVD